MEALTGQILRITWLLNVIV